MPKMREADLRAMIASQHADALAASNASKLSAARSDALMYYQGDMTKDMPSAVGRSSAVSMDVADTIEGMMPQLMEIFAGTDEVVKFEPVGPEDVKRAEQETDYINHVFMNQNPGFLVLYSFIKDALLSKTGIVKVWWEKEEREERETYYDKTTDEFALIVSNPDVEIVEHTEHPAEADPNAEALGNPVGGAIPGGPGTGVAAGPDIQRAGGMGGGEPPSPQTLHDITVVTKKTYARAHVLGVPPEEFGIERGARNIRDCNYCFHKVVDRTEADLIAQGYDKEQVKRLPSYRGESNTEELNRDTVDENSNAGSDEINTAARLVEITEHYVRMDYEDNGKASLYQVVTGGSQGEVLKRDDKLAIDPFDAIPFAAMTPVIMTHRFMGRSVADLVMDIQRIKTALLRGLLDSIYLATNRRTEVAESHASEDTLDDLLVSRPGGIVRTKLPGGLREIETGDVGTTVYPALEYMDQRLETRTGYTKRGQGIDADALSNQSATAAKIVENASQARVRLIARIFAETGIRDLFWLLHATIKKHGQQAAVVRLRNNWVSVDPREWKSREDLTIHVGLGTGGKAQQLAETQILIGAQTQAIAAGMVSKRNLYATARRLTKVLGEPDCETYFVDPSKPPDQQDPSAAAIQPPADPKVQQIQMQAQLDAQSDQRKSQLDQQALQQKAQIETVQAQADIATQQQKTQADMAIADRKAQLEERLMLLDHELKREMHAAELQMKRELHQHAMASSQMGMVATAQTHEAKMEQMNNKPEAGA